MIAAALLSGILWFGLLTMRAGPRWVLSIFEIALMALAAGLIVRRKLEIRLHPVGALLAAAAAWAAAQAALGFSVDPQRTLEAAPGWTVNCAAFSLALAATQKERVLRWFLTAQMIFGLGLSIAAVIWRLSAGVLGPFAYYNQFAAYAETVLGMALAAAITDRRRSVVWLLVAAALTASVVAGGSRAGSLLCIAELIVIPAVAFLQGRIGGKPLLKIGAVAALSAAVLIGVVGWETVWHRLQEPHPYSLRANLLRSSMDMSRDRPLTGFGVGAWPSAYPAYARYDDGTYVNQAHNDWAQWAVEGGIPFLLAMAAMVAFLARPAFRSLWGLGLLAVFVHAFVDYPFEQRPALAAFFFALVGVLCAAREGPAKSTS